MSGAAKFYPGGKGVKEEKKEHAILYKFVAEPNSKPLQLGFDGNFISVSEVKEVIADQKRMDPHDIDLLPHDPQATPLGENLPTIAEESGFDDHQRGAGHSTGGPAAVPYRNEERLVHATLVWVKRRPALKSRIGTIEVDAVSRGFKPTPMSPSSGDDDEELVEHEEDVYPHAWPKDFICQICSLPFREATFTRCCKQVTCAQCVEETEDGNCSLCDEMWEGVNPDLSIRGLMSNIDRRWFYLEKDGPPVNIYDPSPASPVSEEETPGPSTAVKTFGLPPVGTGGLPAGAKNFAQSPRSRAGSRSDCARSRSRGKSSARQNGENGRWSPKGVLHIPEKPALVIPEKPALVIPEKPVVSWTKVGAAIPAPVVSVVSAIPPPVVSGGSVSAAAAAPKSGGLARRLTSWDDGKTESEGEGGPTSANEQAPAPQTAQSAQTGDAFLQRGSSNPLKPLPRSSSSRLGSPKASRPVSPKPASPKSFKVGVGAAVKAVPKNPRASSPKHPSSPKGFLPKAAKPTPDRTPPIPGGVEQPLPPGMPGLKVVSPPVAPATAPAVVPPLVPAAAPPAALLTGGSVAAKPCSSSAGAGAPDGASTPVKNKTAAWSAAVVPPSGTASSAAAPAGALGRTTSATPAPGVVPPGGASAAASVAASAAPAGAATAAPAGPGVQIINGIEYLVTNHGLIPRAVYEQAWAAHAQSAKKKKKKRKREDEDEQSENEKRSKKE